MARPGYSRVALVALFLCAAWILLPGTWRWWVGGALTVLLVLVVNFYRDPNREGPAGGSGRQLLSPADGRVVAVQRAANGLQISIFLSAFNVHVNRAPVSGRVTGLTRTPGVFLPAFLDRASTENERVCLEIDSPESGRVICTQVAGLLARRIENWIEVGQELTQGERYGMIHLGSRVDLEVSPSFVAVVKPGDHVRGGATVLAEIQAG